MVVDLDALVRKPIMLRRDVGINILEVIEKMAIKTTYDAILELVTNAHDEDAHNIHIDYQSLPQRELIIRDDGLGMTPEDLPNFYRSGDSVKIKNPYSPGGRKRIGKFGIGTILLSYLAGESELWTAKAGFATTVHEEYNQALTTSQEFPAYPQACDSSMHGTKITLKQLRFDDGELFSVRDLKRKIQWTLRLLPDFNVHVNGEKLVSRVFAGATRYRIREVHDVAGHVRGTLHVTLRNSDMAGIYVYVNNHLVGDPGSYIAGLGLPSRFVSRLIGIIDANGLEDAVLYNHKFHDEHDGVKYLRRMIALAIDDVKVHYDRSLGSGSGIGKKMPKDILSSARDRYMANVLPGITSETRIVLSEEGMNSIGSFDGSTLVLNPDHPLLQMHAGSNRSMQEHAILTAVVDVLAHNKVNATSLMLEKMRLWSSIAKREASLQTLELHPRRIYDYDDLAMVASRSKGSLRYLSRGVLQAEDDEGFTGESYMKAVHATRQMTSLYDLVAVESKSVPAFDNVLRQADRIGAMLHVVGDVAKPFVRNFGSRQMCYFVEDVCLPDIRGILFDTGYAGRWKEAFSALHEEHVTMPNLGKRLGMRIDDVAAVQEYARQHTLPLRYTFDLAVHYQYGDFISVFQHMRGITGDNFLVRQY